MTHHKLYHFINGSFSYDPSISLLDYNIKGLSVFERFKVEKGVPMFLNEHLDRLLQMMKLIGIDAVYSKEQLKGIIQQLLEKNNIENIIIRIISTTEKGLLTILCEHEIDPPSSKSLTTTPFSRPLPEIKTTSCLASIMAKKLANDHGFDDGLFINEGILEATQANIFFIKKKHIITAKSKILPGITRAIVLKLIEGYSIDFRELKIEELPHMEGAFLTNSTQGIVPVDKINQHKLDNHPYTEKLKKIYDNISHKSLTITAT